MGQSFVETGKKTKKKTLSLKVSFCFYTMATPSYTMSHELQQKICPWTSVSCPQTVSSYWPLPCIGGSLTWFKIVSSACGDPIQLSTLLKLLWFYFWCLFVKPTFTQQKALEVCYRMTVAASTPCPGLWLVRSVPSLVTRTWWTLATSHVTTWQWCAWTRDLLRVVCLKTSEWLQEWDSRLGLDLTLVLVTDEARTSIIATFTTFPVTRYSNKLQAVSPAILF